MSISNAKKISNKKWREKNKEAISKYNKEWKEKHKTYYKEYCKKYHLKINLAQKKYSQKKRKELLVLLGNKCVKCGFADWRALQIDHINGGGHKERKAMGPFNYYKKVYNDTETKYQLLCANCNWIKRYENKELENI